MCFLGMKLTMSCCIICVFALLINKASLQAVDVAVGFTGGSIVLPCASTEIQHKLSDINVRWRHNDSLILCDIIHGNFSLQHQHFNFKDRVETFPTEYEKGNFSLKLNSLTHTDAGHYQCYILHTSEQLTTQLNINDKGEKPTEETGNPAQEAHLWIILASVLSVLICLVLCITFIWKKTCKKNSRSGASPPEAAVVFHQSKQHVNGNESNNHNSLLQSQNCSQN